MLFDQLRRCDFITLIGGTAVARPLAVDDDAKDAGPPQ
jgi:hypothetical protein